jgi:hypothetical protein
MTNHDPLASALLVKAMETRDHAAWQVQADRTYESDATAILDTLDAAGYEVRPKLTTERLAAALHEANVDCDYAQKFDRKSCSERLHSIQAAAILAALERTTDD